MKEDLGNFTDLFSDIVNAEVQNVNLNSKNVINTWSYRLWKLIMDWKYKHIGKTEGVENTVKTENDKEALEDGLNENIFKLWMLRIWLDIGILRMHWKIE